MPQNPAGSADERRAGGVFTVARGFPDEKNLGRDHTIIENDLIPVVTQVAAFAVPPFLDEGLQAADGNGGLGGVDRWLSFWRGLSCRVFFSLGGLVWDWL